MTDTNQNDGTKPAWRVRPASWLHRKLGMTPGDVPDWLITRHSCSSIDVIMAGMMPFILGTVICLAARLWLFSILQVAFLVLVQQFVGPFQSREFLARARRRRDECIWCGQFEVPAGSVCGRCGERN